MLRDAGVFAVSVTGGPGAGKTALIRAALERLARGGWRAGVLTTDPDDNTAHLRSQWNVGYGTGGDRRAGQVRVGLHLPLTADRLSTALGRLDLAHLDVLLVERDAGPAAAPAADDLGEAARVRVFSVAAGDRAAAAHPEFVRGADLVVLTKADLLSLVPFDVDSFRGDVRRVNPGAAWAATSATGGDGAGPWIDWLAARVPAPRDDHPNIFT